MAAARARAALRLTAVAVASAVFALAAVRWLPPVAAGANFFDDIALARFAPPEPQHPRVAILALTDETLSAYPYRSPVDRGLLAELVVGLGRAGVRAIGLDVLVDQPTEPAKDEALRQAILASGAPVVMLTAGAATPMSARQRAYHAAFLDGMRRGHGNLARDVLDGTVRRHVPMLQEEGGAAMPSLPAALAGLLGASVPDEPFEIAWRAPPDTATQPFPMLPAHALALLPPAWLAGKVVLVGAQLPDLDRHRAPISPVGATTAGVEIQAHVLAQLLDGRASPRLGAVPQAATALLFAGTGAGLGILGIGTAAAAALAVALVASLWAASAAALAVAGILLPPVAPSLALLLAFGLTAVSQRVYELRQRAMLMRLFAAYVSAPVADEIWRHRDTIVSGGRPRPQRLVATVLFSDVEDFTPLSERLGPDRLMAWLETYMAAMTAEIAGHDGVVLRFIGDGILAAFGAPIPHTDPAAIERDAVQAVRCALAMGEALRPLNQAWAAQGLPEIRIRVGIFTGPMVGGSVGMARHLEYTLMGDAVNTAARLEALGKTVPAAGPDALCRILVGQPTWERVGGWFAARCVGDMALKGKTEAVRVYQVLGMAEAADRGYPVGANPDGRAEKSA